MKCNNWLRRGICLALAVWLALAWMPVCGRATAEESTIPEDAIYLSTAADVTALATKCIKDTWSQGKTVVLQNDIDMTGVDFGGIPTFGGTFLGQGHTIRGISLTEPKTALGFFRYLQRTAVVTDLHIEAAVRPAAMEDSCIGGIVGVNSGTVRGCTFSGAVCGLEQVGGIAGHNKTTGVIDGCSVSGVVYGSHYIGGIAGENQGVVRNCVNRSEVNTQVDHNSLSPDILGILESELDELELKESAEDATNIGGITGINSGVLRDCENRGNVGYEKLGYNVGGIAGSQTGYITGCANYGVINGSDGVGGIVGQFKPNMVLEFGENPLDAMTREMQSMMNSMNSMMGTMNSMTTGLMPDFSDEKESIQSSMDILKDPQSWDEDSMNAAMNDMSASMKNMYGEISSMGDKMSSSMSNMQSSMNGMMASMNSMVNTMSSMDMSLEIEIIDISLQDTPDNTLTKVSNCANYGHVIGERYVGGITGLADVEDTTVQDDLESLGDLSNNGELIVRLVIRDCRNYATVAASKKYAGGVVGNMAVGAVIDCRNTGSIDALNADYVGGIAGSSDTAITGSLSRCVLAGGDYVGGIAGFGTQVTDCYAMSDIAAATRFAGGVLGSAAALPEGDDSQIRDNGYYLAGENLGGIDGINYSGATARLTLKKFLALDVLDEQMRTVTVRFTAEGQEDVVRTVELGGSLDLADVPVVETQAHQTCDWEYRKSITSQTLSYGQTEEVLYLSVRRLTGLLFDQHYCAVVDGKNTVIAADLQTESGRPVLLAVGSFDKYTTVKVENLLERESTVNGVGVWENWSVTLSDTGVEKLHYRIPDGADADALVLYVKSNAGTWTQREYTVEGSYLIFSFTPEEQGFALAQPEQTSVDLNMNTVIIGAEAAIIVLLAAKLMPRKKKKAE